MKEKHDDFIADYPMIYGEGSKYRTDSFDSYHFMFMSSKNQKYQQMVEMRGTSTFFK